MITHFHVRLQIPDTEIYRDVVLPDSVILGDINQVISVCFGWPLTDAYEFVPQQTGTTYLGDTDSFVGAKQSLDAENIPVSFAFQKNRELVYYCGTSATDRVSVTLLPSKSLLPEPEFQLNYWHGENQPCSQGGEPFLKQKVEDDLLALREELYLLSDEFDYENAITPDFSESFNLLEEIKNSGSIEEIAQLLDGIPEEDALAFITEMVGHFQSQTEETFTLSQCLAMLDKKELEDIIHCNRFPVSGLSDRAALEDIILRNLTSEEFLNERFKTLTIPEIELLRLMCSANMPFDTPDASLHSLYLLRCGLCYLSENGFYLTVPEELRPLYTQVLQNESVMMETQFYDMLHTFCYTAVYFYGAYPVRHLLRRINETMQLVIPLNELEETVGPTQMDRNDYVLRDGWIIAAEMAQDTPEYRASLEQLKAMQNLRTDFFWPDLEQLETLIFSRCNIELEYFENFYDFRPYLNSGLNFSHSLANIEYWIRSGVSFEDVLHSATSSLFTLPGEEQTSQMVYALQELWNHTPMWTLGGYTPAQMREKEQNAAAKNNGKKNTGKVISFQEHLDKKKK